MASTEGSKSGEVRVAGIETQLKLFRLFTASSDVFFIRLLLVQLSTSTLLLPLLRTFSGLAALHPSVTRSAAVGTLAPVRVTLRPAAFFLGFSHENSVMVSLLQFVIHNRPVI